MRTFFNFILQFARFFILSANNKLQFINGKLFQPLNKLSDLRLHSNICINEGATSLSEVVSLSQKVNAKCGFNESVISKTSTKEETENIEKLKAELIALKMKIFEAEAKSQLA